MADMGADVVKIEELQGDVSRKMIQAKDGFSGFFESLARGKRSIALDLRRPEAVDVIFRLVPEADVLVENFRLGVMDRLGLGWEEISKRNKRLIYASANGFGFHGEMSRKPAYDPLGQAMSGLNTTMGGGPGGTPYVSYSGLADQVSALYLCQGILLALLAREQTGRGQRVEVSLLGTQIAFQCVDITAALRTGRHPRRRFRPFATVGPFEAGDGKWLMVSAVDARMNEGLLRCMGLEWMKEDERFRTGWAREKNVTEFEPYLEQAFLKHGRDEWLGLLEQHDVPAGPVYDYLEMADHPQVAANNLIVEQQHERFGAYRTPGLAINLSETPGSVPAAAPEVGQHTLDILREAGLDAAEIEALVADGVARAAE
jgi:crotonobetainyl-CoA:carnitine CoA-transferase CaiB-like acyl-CoA transferase